MTNKQSLSQIARKLKMLERNTIGNVVEIGRLLHEAREQCEHGEYTAWLSREFSWSYRTSLRYYYVYAFAQRCQGVTFEKLNISLSALHLVADVHISEVARKAIIRAALKGRVTHSIAKAIIAKAAPDDPPIGPPPIEPIDEEEEPTTGDGDGPSPPQPSDEAGGQPSAAAALRTVSCISERDDAWPKIIAAIGGSVKLREIIEILETVYTKHCADKGGVKSAADRAEAKSRMHH